MNLKRYEIKLLDNLGLDWRKHNFNPWFNGTNITIYYNHLKSGVLYCSFVHKINWNTYYVELRPYG